MWGKFIFLFLFIFLIPTAHAGSFNIIEVQTRGDGGAYDEFVKINGSGTLTGFILQSRSATSDKWVSRSGEGLPNINIEGSAILASANYSGTDEIWRHTSRWGFSDEGGGVRLLDGTGNVIAEKYWGTLDTSTPIPTPEPEPEPDIPLLPSDEGSKNDSEPELTTPLAPVEESIDDSNSAPTTPLTPTAVEGLPSTEGSRVSYSSFPITISEFIPDPVGSDDSEWIEIKNLSNETIDISNWKIDDEEGGSKPFQIPENSILSPNSYFVFYKTQTKLALNNDEDGVRLIDPLLNIFQEIEYSDNKVGVSYALKDDKWSWTTSPTPGSNNLISVPEPEKPKTSTKQTSVTTYAGITALKNIRDLSTNSKITTQGFVSAIPGSLGSQIFYILDDIYGIQVYMYSKNFPEINIGDEVRILGVLSEASGETRIKISKKEDIEILSTNNELSPIDVEIENIGEELEGVFVKTSGEVIEMISNGFYLSDEEGNEIKVYFKSQTELSNSLVSLGEKIEVQGIVSQTSSGYRILPRYKEDINIKEGSKKISGEKTGAIDSKYKYYGILGGGMLAFTLLQAYKRRDLIIQKLTK